MVEEYSDGSKHILIYNDINPVCPTRPNDNTDASLSQRSTCPNDFVISIDETRIPRVISMARCLCEYCLDCGGRKEGNVCEPVLQDVDIMRRVGCNENGVYDWKKDTIKITTSCTCAVPKII